MSHLNDPLEMTGDGTRAVRVAERAGAEHVGASLYELGPGDEMVLHYHVQREELLIVLTARLSLRTADGWEELPEGEVDAFPRGECGARTSASTPTSTRSVSAMPDSEPGGNSVLCSTSLTPSRTTEGKPRSCRLHLVIVRADEATSGRT